MTDTILGTLITAIVGGVLAILREQIKYAREDKLFYRDTLLPAVEKLTGAVSSVEKSVRNLTEEARQKDGV